MLKCPVCDADEGQMSESNVNGLTNCYSCGHWFQTDLKITANYDASYIRNYDNLPHVAMSEIRWRFIQRNINLPKGSKILDVGYANGSFLERAEQGGMDVYGIDVHGQNYGIREVTFDTPIEYDLITFYDSLEHFDNFEFLSKLKTKYLVVSLPITYDSLLEENPVRWKHYKPGEHLHYFTGESLCTLIKHYFDFRLLKWGYPEDAIRDPFVLDGLTFENILTTIYGK